MPQTGRLEKAQLIEVWPDDRERGTFAERPGAPGASGATAGRVTVQFNPATLKQSFSNQNVSSGQAGDTSSQHPGRGSTKLTFELVFDATRSPGGDRGLGVRDVRDLTDAVAYFLRPQKRMNGEKEELVPPGVRFLWGSFLFDGTMDALEETIDLFSENGVPLRATLNVGISKQNLDRDPPRTPPPSQGLPGGLGRAGTDPLSVARAGESLQQLAARSGVADWQAVARANGIENPRLLAPGTSVSLLAAAAAARR